MPINIERTIIKKKNDLNMNKNERNMGEETINDSYIIY